MTPMRTLALASLGLLALAGILHNARNEGATALKLTAAFVVRKGVPLVVPAPEP